MGVTPGLDDLSPACLEQLASALETGALSPPFPAFALARHVGDGRAEAVADALCHAAAGGVDPTGLAFALRLLANERVRLAQAEERVHLVWTGPEAAASASRDTSVVVQELFASARTSVLVAGFVAVQGKTLFEPLSARLAEHPELIVRMFFNVGRPYGDTSDDSEILRRFAERFREEHWPWESPPAVFYDPRALSRESGPRSVLHAKCVVVDDERALVTSANFTEAAQERNIEAGGWYTPHRSRRLYEGNSNPWSGRGRCCACRGSGERGAVEHERHLGKERFSDAWASHQVTPHRAHP